MSAIRRSILLPLAAVLLIAQVAAAGPNAGFVASLDEPLRIENPAPGDVIELLVRAAGTTEIKGIVILAQYDPALVEFLSYSIGDVTPTALALPKPPVFRDDGLAEVEGGSTILGAGLTSVSSGGLLGTFQFRLIDDLPDEGTGIWLTSVEVNTSAQAIDEDVLSYSPGDLGVSLAVRYANRVFNAEVTRSFDGATIAWESRFAGLADTLRVRATGDSLWHVATAGTAASFDPDVVTAARLLFAAGVAIADSNVVAARDSVLDAAALGPPYADGFLASLASLNQRLLSRRHLVRIDGLTADTQYEYVARSAALDGALSNRLTGLFRTRLAPDLRPVAGTDLNVQATITTASASWFTNRLADTQMLVSDSAGNQVATVELDTEGSLVHAATVSGLMAATEYGYVVTSRLIGAEQLIAQGFLTEEQVTFVKTGTFRTSDTRQPLRLLAPPAQVVSPEAAVVHFELNQIALATIAYGLLSADNTELVPYQFSTSTGDILNEHSVTLSDLTPATRYRYRLSVVTPDGDSLSTDPRGNQQWSRDLQFTTSAAGDTLPPVIVEGPFVHIGDVLAIVSFETDVDTRASIFLGTRGGTYGTPDEFEIADRTVDGNLRLSQQHSITVSGLELGDAYDYGIVVEATNGQTASFEPNLPAGKRARASKRLKVLQPPGGAGSFTTNIEPDTQYPVILAGPTVASKTDKTAIVEWTTDEPSTSNVDFGVDAVGEARTNSGATSTRHKIVLSNLEAGTPYVFQVGSTDAVGNGATTSSEGVFTTNPEVDLTAPALTRQPSVIYQNDEVATIQWTTDENATGQVEFGVLSGVLGFIRTLSTTGTVHEVTLTNLTPSTTYFYRVSSYDLSNNGPSQSDVMSLTTDPLPDGVPPVIDSVVVTGSDSTAIISWTTDELADSFVDLGTVSGVLGKTVGDASDVLEHEVTLTNLLPGTQYFLTVGSSDRAGNGPTESAELTFTTQTSADTTAPATPTGLAGISGNQSVTLTWEANSEADLAGYNVSRRVSGSDSFTALASRLTLPQYTDLSVQNDVAYEYQISAMDRTSPAANESEASAALPLTPSLSAAPTAPTDLHVDGEALRPRFNFANAEPFLLGASLSYTIQVSTQPDFSDVTASKSGITPGIGSTSWTITRSLEDGADYYWRVRAVEGPLLGPFTTTQQFTASTAPLLPGDFNDSGAVDFDDFFAFVDAFGGSADDFPLFDLNASGPGTFIDFDDFFAFVDAFGTTAGKSAGAVAATRLLDESVRIRLHADTGLDGASSLSRDMVRLGVHAQNLTDVQAYGLTLTWDPAILSFVDAHAAQSTAGDGFFRVLEQRPGRVLLGNAGRAGQTVKDGSLAQLTFRLRHQQLANDARIHLDQVLLAAPTGQVSTVPPTASVALLPTAFTLGQAYPNPFNPSTQIDFSLAAETDVQLVVYDVLGQMIRTLLPSQTTPAGFYSVGWDGRDSAGRPVGNGLYFYRLTTPRFADTGRMMMLK
jgi:hypothetical protein